MNSTLPQRPYPFHTNRSWHRNPNFKHGFWSKTRWALEDALEQRRPWLAGLAVNGVPPECRPWLERLITIDQPADWLIPNEDRTRFYLPARLMARARQWLRLADELYQRIRQAATRRMGWRARYQRLARANDHGNDHTINRSRDRQTSSNPHAARMSAAAAHIAAYKRHLASTGQPFGLPPAPA